MHICNQCRERISADQPDHSRGFPAFTIMGGLIGVLGAASTGALLLVGVVSESALKRLSNFLILLVCTGNTCRSPMAELLLRRRLGDKLDCGLDQLEDRGVTVMSAGIAAMVGGRASAEAVEVMRKRQLDLSRHESQPLSERLVRHADIIWTMTRSHRDAIVAQWPAAAARTDLLCTDPSDVPDPIGGPRELYDRCAEQIDTQLEARLQAFDFAALISNVKAD